MLAQLGKKRRSDPNLVELLLECHGRIRQFVALARAAAEREDAASSEIAQACADVERYFVEALPLHVADEEESLLPRLRGRSAELDRVLSSMCAQHAAHVPVITALLASLAALRASPDDRAHKETLGRAVADVEREFVEHLSLEERLLFPALAQLDAATEREIVSELRARRRP